MDDKVEAYKKSRIALRYWLHGRGYDQALVAMEFAEQYHQGVRKDGITPESSHQVAIVSFLRTLIPHMRSPEDTLVAAFLHDVREDYDVDDATIRSNFGSAVADAVEALTKVYRGIRKQPEEVFAAIAADPIASVVKPADRAHNMSTMLGAFTDRGVAHYIEETNELVLPALKDAKRRFPSQEPIYENLKFVLTTQVAMAQAFLGAGGAAK